MKPSVLHLLSCKVVEFLANIKGPSFLLVPVIKIYSNIYGAKTEEASKALNEYESFDAFFTREIKPGLRTVKGEIISPVDGLLVDSGDISETTNIKGNNLNISQILQDKALYNTFEGGTYFNFYLAPGDYHRIHAPISGETVSITHIPGTLYSVKPNDSGKSVLALNRRVVIHLKTAIGSVAVVLIGALNVGKIEVVSNKIFNVGDHLGTFHLGSSVVVIFPNGMNFKKTMISRKIKMGEDLRE